MVELNLIDLISLAFSGDFNSLLPKGSQSAADIRSDIKGINSAKCEYDDLPRKITV